MSAASNGGGGETNFSLTKHCYLFSVRGVRMSFLLYATNKNTYLKHLQY